MGNISKLRVSLDDESAGRWVHWLDGIKFKIRRSTYAPYQTARRKLLRDAVASFDPETSDAAAIAHGGILADHLVVDWEGVEAPGGQIPAQGSAPSDERLAKVPCTIESKRALFTNPEYKDLIVNLLRASANPDNFIVQMAREDGEKSEPALSGNSEG